MAWCCVLSHDGMIATWTALVYYCYPCLLLINISASVLFVQRLPHYAQSIFILPFQPELAHQLGDLNSCLRCESQVGSETGGREGWDAWHRQMVMVLSMWSNAASNLLVPCIDVWEGCRSNVWQCFECVEWWITWPEGTGAAAAQICSWCECCNEIKLKCCLFLTAFCNLCICNMRWVLWRTAPQCGLCKQVREWPQHWHSLCLPVQVMHFWFMMIGLQGGRCVGSGGKPPLKMGFQSLGTVSDEEPSSGAPEFYS